MSNKNLLSLLSTMVLLLAFAATALANCKDGLDNDGDGLVDALDPGCQSPDDPDEEDLGPTCRVNLWVSGNPDQGLLNGQIAGPIAVEVDQWEAGTDFVEVSSIDPFSGAPSVGVLGYAPYSSMYGTGAPELRVARTVEFNFELTHELATPEILVGRYGSETNEIRLNGVLLGTTSGEDGVMHRTIYKPAALQPGPHTISITYVGDAANNGNYLDFVALNGCLARPACSDGWDNDGDGLADMLDPACQSPDQDTEISDNEATGAAKAFQIGKFDAFKGPNANSVLEFLRGDIYYPEMTYVISGNGTDSPPLGGFLSDNLLLSQATYPDGTPLTADGRPLIVATKQINLIFTLESELKNAEIRFTRMGNETNTILLNDVVVAETVADSGVMKAFFIPVGDIPAGTHTLTIRYDNGGLDNGNYWDAIALIGYPQVTDPTDPPPPPPPPPVTPTPTPSPEPTVSPEPPGGDIIINVECPEGKEYDLCGVCGGDNSSCRTCEAIGLEPTLNEILRLSNLQLHLARRAHQKVIELARTSKKANAKRLAKQSKKELKVLSPRYTAESMVNLRLTYPMVVVTSCDITLGCATAELDSAIADFESRALQHYTAGLKAMAAAKKLGAKLKDPKSNDARRLARIESTRKNLVANLDILPAQSLICN